MDSATLARLTERVAVDASPSDVEFEPHGPVLSRRLGTAGVCGVRVCGVAGFESLPLWIGGIDDARLVALPPPGVDASRGLPSLELVVVTLARLRVGVAVPYAPAGGLSAGAGGPSPAVRWKAYSMYSVRRCHIGSESASAIRSAVT